MDPASERVREVRRECSTHLGAGLEEGAGVPGLRFMLSHSASHCQKRLNHPKAAGVSPIKALPPRSRVRVVQTCVQNHTEGQGDRSEDYTHPFLHPSSFSLSLSITPTHTFCLLLCLVSLSSHTMSTKQRLGQVCA